MSKTERPSESKRLESTTKQFCVEVPNSYPIKPHPVTSFCPFPIMMLLQFLHPTPISGGCR